MHGFGERHIRGNHMDHALPHGNGNHNDFIQIGAGGPWTIDANWFGVRTNGAASIWLDPIHGGLIHDAVISNNVVTGHAPGQYVGIFVGGDGTSAALLPRTVSVVNNTVVSGLSNSLRFGRAYATLPPEQRPLVVNNTGERLVGMCDRIRSGHNVFGFGQACAPTDVIGDPRLDAAGAPTAASTLLLDRADPAFAPPLDYFGYARTVGAPDIGAIELGARPAAPAAPARTAARCGHAAPRPAPDRVRVRTANSTRFTVTLLRGRAHRRAGGAHGLGACTGVRLTLVDSAARTRGRPRARVRAGWQRRAACRGEGAAVTQARLDALVAFALAAALALWLTPLAARIAAHTGSSTAARPTGGCTPGRSPSAAASRCSRRWRCRCSCCSPRWAGARTRSSSAHACARRSASSTTASRSTPSIKLMGEVAAAAIPVSAGATIDHLTLPLLHPLDLGALQYPVTMLWIVALMNSFNFIDGMDGLAAGIGAITASTFAILALSLNRGGAALLAAALAGACLGFLRHNFHPARVFMGDAGSLTLGYLLAVIAIQGVLKTAAAVALLFPMLVLLVPIFDTSFVLLHRIKYGRRALVGRRQPPASSLRARGLRAAPRRARALRLVRPARRLRAGAALPALAYPQPRARGCDDHPRPARAGRDRRDGVDRGRARGLKQRHLQLFGLGATTTRPADMPVIEAWRRRRAAAGVKH